MGDVAGAAGWAGRSDFRIAGLPADAAQAGVLDEMARVACYLARLRRAAGQPRREA